jgi:D-amino-acid oxidase
MVAALERSRPHFAGLADKGGCGVRRHTHWEAASTPQVLPDYLQTMPDLEMHEFPDVPGGYAYGRSFTTFLIDMPLYIAWLHEQIRRAGGEFVYLPNRLRDLDDLARLPHERLFNCTGLGARELCNDPTVYPIRGQLAIVAPQPQLTWSISADGFYVYPRSRDTVIGGTSEPHVWDETADLTVASLLLRAGRRILPELTDASLLRITAGLRPFRQDSIRIETEIVKDRVIVHNYGHGGAGITLSWGSAELALELAATGRFARWPA